MLAIADEFDRQGLDARECSLEIAIHGAEPWTPAMREEIEVLRFRVIVINLLAGPLLVVLFALLVRRLRHRWRVR